MAWTWFHKLGSPPHVYRLAGTLTPWFAWIAAALIAYGLIGGLVISPADYQQGEGYRILYVHAPTAWMSLQVYVVMAIASAVGLIWRIKVAHAAAASCGSMGATFTACALATGSLWGGPMWGTYWEWDPRIIFELVLLFQFLGYVGLRAAIDDTQRVGVINIPIIHYSVEWWNSLHQTASVMKLDSKPTMPMSMLMPLMSMFLGYVALFGALLLTRLRAELLSRERSASWIREVVHA
jgi:heme exporter protein C